jgi:hypothetical protein
LEPVSLCAGLQKDRNPLKNAGYNIRRPDLYLSGDGIIIYRDHDFFRGNGYMV